MNKFTSNQHCHSLIEQISWRRQVSPSVRDKAVKFAVSVDSPKHAYVIVSSLFSLRNMISGGDEGETGQSQRANIQSRRDNKGRRKTALDGRMPLGRLCCYYVWKGLLSCCVGQLETGGLSGGGSRHNNPSIKYS